MIRKIVKISFVIVMLMLAVKLFGYFATHKADELCQSIVNDSSVDEVKAHAGARGYSYFESTKGGITTIVIPTQDSPFFRFACVITFDRDTLIHKEVRADD